MISFKFYLWQSALYLLYETGIDFNFTTNIAKTRIMQYSALWFNCFISFHMFFTSWHRLGRSYMILWMFFMFQKRSICIYYLSTFPICSRIHHFGQKTHVPKSMVKYSQWNICPTTISRIFDAGPSESTKR